MSPAERARIYELLVQTRALRLRRVPTEENPLQPQEESDPLWHLGLDPKEESLRFQLLANDLSEELGCRSAQIESLLARALASRKSYEEFTRSLGI
jgi:hypothetical protein